DPRGVLGAVQIRGDDADEAVMGELVTDIVHLFYALGIERGVDPPADAFRAAAGFAVEFGGAVADEEDFRRAHRRPRWTRMGLLAACWSRVLASSRRWSRTTRPCLFSRKPGMAMRRIYRSLTGSGRIRDFANSSRSSGRCNATRP